MMSLGPVYGEAAGKYHDVIPNLSFVKGRRTALHSFHLRCPSIQDK